MPIYQYRCMHCDLMHEALQKMSDPLLTDCPRCGEPQLKKQVTAAAFKLKGTGWYATDFKDPKPQSQNGAAMADGAKEGASEARSEQVLKKSSAKVDETASTSHHSGSGASASSAPSNTSASPN